MNAFKGNVVLITGASTGIGEELACRLAGTGAKLVLAARRIPELERVAVKVRALGAPVLVVACDVSKHDDCKRAVAETLREFGRLDTLVVNAGATMWAKFENIEDPEILDRLMQVNYMGAVYCTHAALPHLKISRGRIVGIASLTALTGVPTRTGYAASKHAMRGIFDSLRIELSESGVTVTMIYPGFIATGIRENATGADGKAARIDPVNQDEVMSVEECVSQILPVIAARKRELVMTLRGRLGQWAKLIAPGLVDRIAKRAVEGNEKYVGPT